MPQPSPLFIESPTRNAPPRRPAISLQAAAAFYSQVLATPGYADFGSPEDHFAWEDLQRFIATFGLQSRRCLEIGCGRGLFQDLVEDYTGLDVGRSAARHGRRPLICGDAAHLPFKDRQFDAVWSITVLEHLRDPEAALSEMRRVLRPGGRLFLKAAWHCRPWICEGIPVRPYGELSLRQRWLKATLPVRECLPVRATRYGLQRLIGLLRAVLRRSPSSLPFRRLPANYGTCWMVDSDASVSLDPFDVIVWFRSRGDTVLSHPTLGSSLTSRSEPLVVQVC